VTPTPVAFSSVELAVQAVNLINQQRASRGLRALNASPSITAAAGAYARLMAEKNWFGHDGPDGSTPQSRLTASGYTGSFKGEALAAGQSTAESAVAAWLASPAHAAIVLSPDAVDIGIGVYYRGGSAYGSYWVLTTGVP
jgi:uncharacterized protein YkwD